MERRQCYPVRGFRYRLSHYLYVISWHTAYCCIICCFSIITSLSVCYWCRYSYTAIIGFRYPDASVFDELAFGRRAEARPRSQITKLDGG